MKVLLVKNWVVQSQNVLKEIILSAMIRMKEFLTRYKNPTKSIDVAFERKIQQRIEHNQDTRVAFQNYTALWEAKASLRGHRDDDIHWFEEEESSNPGIL